MFFLVFVVLVVTVVYFYGVKPFGYWKKKGVPYVKPAPVLGSIWPALFRKKNFTDLLLDFYMAYPDSRYVGFYNFSLPTLILREPELIKTIIVKEFDTFPIHRTFASEDVDPLWGKNLFQISNPEKWHDMRSALSPSFTSTKMKAMFNMMVACAKQFTKHYQINGKTTTVEMKDAFTRYTNDVIASTAFGVTCDSLKNRDNEFYVMGKGATDFTGLKGLRFFINTFSPFIAKLFKIGIITDDTARFFRGVIKTNLELREKQGIVRPDMIHLLMEARKGRLKYDQQAKEGEGFAVVEESERGRNQKREKTEITDEDITAQALLFYLAGFDTVSTAMTFATYELVANPEVQKKLQAEVDKTFAKHGGEITYEALMGMNYLDMVVTETLRKWPPNIATDRLSKKPFTLEPERAGEKPIHLPEGSSIWVPIMGIHRDPKYYPEPNKFDPERFSDENKREIKPFTYMPFGAGPRNCIGSRFALLETKIILTEILKNFEIVRTEKTVIPVKLDKTNFTLLSENGMWVGLKPRKVVS